MPDRLRNKKSDKAKRNFELNGKFSAKSIRLFELAQESRGTPNANTGATANANAKANANAAAIPDTKEKQKHHKNKK